MVDDITIIVVYLAIDPKLTSKINGHSRSQLNTIIPEKTQHFNGDNNDLNQNGTD